MPWVYSTLSNDSIYTNYHNDTPNKLPVPIGEQSVLIKGGSGLPDQKTLVTPYGIGTQITEDQLKLLKNNSLFMFHVDKGFITVANRKFDPEKAAADMETRDLSAPLVPADFPEGKAPTVGAPNGNKAPAPLTPPVAPVPAFMQNKQ